MDDLPNKPAEEIITVQRRVVNMQLGSTRTISVDSAQKIHRSNLDEGGMLPPKTRWTDAPDAPSFDLGFDEPIITKGETQQVQSNLGTVQGGTSNLPTSLADWDANWDPQEEQRAWEEADFLAKNKKNVEASRDVSCPPSKGVAPSIPINIGSSTDAMTSNMHDPNPRGIQTKLPAYKKSPFVDYKSKAVFPCSREVTEVYDAVLALGRGTSRDKSTYNSPQIIIHNDYYVSVRELAQSMKPRGELKDTVVEIGIQTIMFNMTENSKKFVMPLRIGTWLLKKEFFRKVVKKLFNNIVMHLDQKDLIMFPMLKIITQAPPGINPVNHYWMINVNLKDERFEVMDSLRTLQDKEFMAAVKTVKDGITLHWETQYSVMIENWPLTDIDVPKQDNTDDCGVYMLQNASMWEAKLLPPYGPAQIPNIRKLQTHSFLKSGKNTQDWKGILKIK